MIITGLVLAALGALVHIYIFYLESIAWRSRRARATFGIASDDEARVTQPLAFNQGFYNLFLAIEIALGIVLIATGTTAVGATLVFVGAGSMVAAALVLVISNPKMASAAAKQGALPLLGVIALAIGLLMS
jgi:putative membrane protein